MNSTRTQDNFDVAIVFRQVRYNGQNKSLLHSTVLVLLSWCFFLTTGNLVDVWCEWPSSSEAWMLKTTLMKPPPPSTPTFRAPSETYLSLKMNWQNASFHWTTGHLDTFSASPTSFCFEKKRVWKWKNWSIVWPFSKSIRWNFGSTANLDWHSSHTIFAASMVCWQLKSISTLILIKVLWLIAVNGEPPGESCFLPSLYPSNLVTWRGHPCFDANVSWPVEEAVSHAFSLMIDERSFYVVCGLNIYNAFKLWSPVVAVWNSSANHSKAFLTQPGGSSRLSFGTWRMANTISSSSGKLRNCYLFPFTDHDWTNGAATLNTVGKTSLLWQIPHGLCQFSVPWLRRKWVRAWDFEWR